MTEYKDYQYVMQDITTLYLGAQFTYEELLLNEEVPFKFKNMIQRCIKPELAMDTTLAGHFYHMDGSAFPYQVYRQLKTKVKFSILVQRKGVTGKTKQGYDTRILPLEQFSAIRPEEKEAQGIFIQEIGVSKMALIGISL